MHNQKHYEDAVRRRARYGYDVVPRDRGYIVRHRSDSDDVSRARNLNELNDFADLMEWAAQRRAAQREPQINSQQPPAAPP
jgi:hypothetical protein